jgi:thiol:disulfide interchange protein DsbD
MGASLGYAITLPWGQALGIFAALGLGLAAPYLVAAWVPGIGKWLPKPGAWMDALRRFMAFFMWATVIWLVWVLGHISGVDGAASLLVLLLAVALIAWSFGQQGWTRPVFATFSIALAALLTTAIGKNILQTEVSLTSSSTTTQAQEWKPWAPGLVDTELAKGNPVFVDFTAAWCITCQYNKKTTLSADDVLADFRAKQVTLLRADWTRRDPAITAALEQLGRSGVPVYVIYKNGRAPVVLSEVLTVSELRTAIATL